MAQKQYSPGFLDELRALFSPKSPAFSHSPTLLDFYSVFMAEKALLSAEILSFEKVYGKDFKPFTVYNIRVRTKTHETKISKRYSEFHALHKTLRKRCPQALLGWRFPEKTLFGNFGSELLEERKRQFQEFLNLLTQGYTENSLIDFLDFLEIHSK